MLRIIVLSPRPVFSRLSLQQAGKNGQTPRRLKAGGSQDWLPHY